jgi:DNA excision repair protein ERCC-6
MTDVQARERSWRIGQKNPVKIYRLIAADSLEEIICKRQIFKHHLAQKILVDPRQSKVHDWDSMFDLFQVPRTFIQAVDSGQTDVKSKTVEKLMQVFESGKGGDDEVRTPDPEHSQLQSLITKVLNQDEIEMPKIASVLVDSEKTEQAASRAIKAVLAEAQSGDITVPTWTGKSGGDKIGISSAKQRSKSLVTKLSSAHSHTAVTTVFESQQLVVEKAVVRELISFFRKQKKFSGSTEKILSEFDAKIGAGGQAEIFRSCLRELCEFDDRDGVWILKSSHR